MSKVGVVTTSRADFGLLFPIMEKIKESNVLELEVIVTGMHLLKEYGNTLSYVKERYPDCNVVDLFLPSIDKYTLVKSMGIGFMSFSEYFKTHNLDCLLVLGDRVELMIPVYSAMIYGIPIAHVFGGDSIDDYVTYDNNVRHAITKLANLHFAATKAHAERIIKMGEEDWRVFNTGSPAIDSILNFNLVDKEILKNRIGKIDINKPYALMTYHPVHMELDGLKKQIRTILDTLRNNNITVVCTKPNNDIGNEVIFEELEKENNKNDKFLLVDSISQEEYYSLIRYSEFMIGNSSSGVLESSSFKVPSINIGSRQKGRIKGVNVLDSECSAISIEKAIHKIRHDEEFKNLCINVESPYGHGESSLKIVKTLEDYINDKDKLLHKRITY